MVTAEKEWNVKYVCMVGFSGRKPCLNCALYLHSDSAKADSVLGDKCS